MAPSLIPQLRTSRYSGDVPCMSCGTQFTFLYTIVVRARTTGAAVSTVGHSSNIASQSWAVNVITLPNPKLTPALDACPGITITTFDPRLSMLFLIAVDEPFPISIIAITAATPITIPSVVSVALIGFRVSARTDVFIVL